MLRQYEALLPPNGFAILPGNSKLILHPTPSVSYQKQHLPRFFLWRILPNILKRTSITHNAFQKIEQRRTLSD
jgi:hypothetical protein